MKSSMVLSYSHTLWPIFNRVATIHLPNLQPVTLNLVVLYLCKEVPFNFSSISRFINTHTGLTNLGNTCYMNACLGLLSSQDSFVNYIKPVFPPHPASLRNETPKRNFNTSAHNPASLYSPDIVRELYKVLSGIRDTTDESIMNSRPLFRAMKDWKVGKRYSQHDAQEYLLYVLRCLPKAAKLLELQFFTRSTCTGCSASSIKTGCCLYVRRCHHWQIGMFITTSLMIDYY